jgi:hypothetical protein
MKQERLSRIGIKQALRIEWFDEVLRYYQTYKEDEKQIRELLDNFLSDKLQRGGVGQRGQKTYKMAITPLITCWVNPFEDTTSIRDAAYDIFIQNPSSNTSVIHWCLMIANYPFWYQVALQCSRLLRLQEKFQNQEIKIRMKEIYGGRNTVERNTRYTVQSLLAWNFIEKTETKGVYKKSTEKIPISPAEIPLLFHSIMLATDRDRVYLEEISSSPILDFFSTHSMQSKDIKHYPFLEKVNTTYHESYLVIKNK